jgi:cysteine desulfurase
VDPRVADLVVELMVHEFGNAGSRTHEYGATAKRVVERARAQVADVVAADVTEVIFTSGATEANNLGLLGLAEHGLSVGRTHIVTTAIEHKAVLEPLDVLAKRGFTVDRVHPDESGAVDAGEVLATVRPETLMVSVMHVNNETGVRQPIGAIAAGLTAGGHDDVFFHCDAAQGFGKEFDDLRLPRVDLVSISGHKIFAPKGTGALIARRRDRRRPPLQPLTYGGGQERGLRPGTQPVALIAALGLAAELAVTERAERHAAALAVRADVLAVVAELGGKLNGAAELSVPHILNVSIPGIDSEAAMVAWRDHVAISNGSACTSASYEPSHVLTAMRLTQDRRREALRISWGPGTHLPPRTELVAALKSLS